MPIEIAPTSVNGASRTGMRAWSFNAESASALVPVNLTLNLAATPVRWRGAFCEGFRKPSFTTRYLWGIDGYNLIDPVHRSPPKAFAVQRDFWVTGGQLTDGLEWLDFLPHAVREQKIIRRGASPCRPRPGPDAARRQVRVAGDSCIFC